MKIYLVAFFKYDPRGVEYGFKRMDLQTFFSSMKKAREETKNYFCDEAGWYEGALIEEREEGSISFKGERVWLIQHQTEGFLYEIPEPECMKCVVNLI